MNYGSSKSAKIILSKSIFDVKNQSINLRDHYLVKTSFFLNSTFEPLYLLKLSPIFDKPTFLIGIFLNSFLGGTDYGRPDRK